MLYDFLRKVPFFADLEDADLKRLCESVAEVRLGPGEELFEEGSPGDQAYIIQSGELEVTKMAEGRKVLLNRLQSGDVVGEIALLEDRPRMATVSACTESQLIAISKEQFDHLLDTSLNATRAIFNTLLKRWRDTEALLRQSEKMAQLGTLTAGIAHELNNPAAAVQRGAGQLQEGTTALMDAQAKIAQLEITQGQRDMLQGLFQQVQSAATRPPEMDGLTRSDREYEIEGWLSDRQVPNAWQWASTLVNLIADRGQLDSLAAAFKSDQLPTVIEWLSALYGFHSLLAEISLGATRIAEIVKALKSYSYLDRAPVQAVDIHEGLDNTLLILRNKLKEGITVRREYARNLPQIQAYGSELNQVWTNLIDNAADALEGRGEITIRTSHDAENVVVEIEDNGPGIPPEVQPRIFDAFFTTKPPGKGTGLGLDITYNIVVFKHHGAISVDSRPGKTVFRVALPLKPG